MNEPYVEPNCTITHDGQEYQSGGAFVSDTYLIAYPAAGGVLRDWHGNQLGTWRPISSRKAVWFGRRSYQGDRYYYMHATVNGRQYSLRGYGINMVARGRALKHQS